MVALRLVTICPVEVLITVVVETHPLVASILEEGTPDSGALALLETEIILQTETKVKAITSIHMTGATLPEVVEGREGEDFVGTATTQGSMICRPENLSHTESEEEESHIVDTSRGETPTTLGMIVNSSHPDRVWPLNSLLVLPGI